MTIRIDPRATVRLLQDEDRRNGDVLEEHPGDDEPTAEELAKARAAEREAEARDQRGDASEDGPPKPKTSSFRPSAAQPGKHPSGFRFTAITSAELERADYRPRWRVERLLVVGQPAVVGGPQKALKTSTMVDLVLSLGLGLPFLGAFAVPQKARVAFLSGESGGWALQETARRVCLAKGADLAAADVLWGFDLPQLANPADLAAIEDGLREHGVEVLVVDPLYLALLAGQTDIQASNLYMMGPLLRGIAAACAAVGCDLVLVHHTTRPAGAKRDPLDLGDLAFSGIGEFARQWLLLNRREAFEPGQPHKLWLVAGGSCGQSGLWALDIDEGALREDFSGRSWDVMVRAATEARKEDSEAKRTEAQQAKAKADDAKALNALDKLTDALARRKEDWRPPTKNQVRVKAGLSGERITQALDRLEGEGIIRGIEISIRTGKGGKTTQKQIGYLREGDVDAFLATDRTGRTDRADRPDDPTGDRLD